MKTKSTGNLKIGTMSREDASEDQELMINGLRILARMIARVYLEERSRYSQKFNEVNTKEAMPIDKTTLLGLQQDVRLALTVTESAKLLGLSRASTYTAIRAGQIPSIRIGQRIIVPKAWLTKILSDRA